MFVCVFLFMLHTEQSEDFLIGPHNFKGLLEGEDLHFLSLGSVVTVGSGLGNVLSMKVLTKIEVVCVSVCLCGISERESQ